MARSTFGSVRERSKGVWQLRYNASGKACSETVRGSRKDAERRLAELQVQYSDIPLASAEMTVAVFWNAVCEQALKERVQATTLSGYASMYNNHILPNFGDVPISQVTYPQVQKLLSSLSYGSARSCKRVLSVIWTEAEKHNLIDINIMRKKYVMPKKSGGVKREVNDDVYSMDELNYIFNACRGEFWEPAYIMSAFGGMRREEAAGIKVGEIDYAEGVAICQIARTVVRISGLTIVKDEAKTDASKRVVTIIEPYASRLIELQAEAYDEGFTWMMDDGFGEVLNPERISNTFKRWIDAQGLRYIPWKNLRNSYATALHEQGVDLSMIAKMLGHKTMHVTYRHYDKPKIDAFIHAQQKLLDSLSISVHKSKKSDKIISFQKRKNAAR